MADHLSFTPVAIPVACLSIQIWFQRALSQGIFIGHSPIRYWSGISINMSL